VLGTHDPIRNELMSCRNGGCNNGKKTVCRVKNLHLSGAIEVDEELARRWRLVPVLRPADLQGREWRALVEPRQEG
jgi:hypothetical protein